MNYGYFDDERREYVITRPDTPLPWINYLGSEAYFSLISNTAGGYSFYRDARLRRITRYRYNNAPLDTGGRCLYIRDDKPPASEPSESLPDAEAALPATEPRVHAGGRPASGPSVATSVASSSDKTDKTDKTDENLYWSPTWQPARRSLDEYECRHGLGYTTILSRQAGIESQVRFFVPLGEDLEIWELTLTNRRDRPADLSIFAAVEFCLWEALDDSTNFQRNLSIGEVEVVDDVIYHKSEYRERRDHFAYFACSEKIAGFDTQREAFLGPYVGWDSPQAVELGRLSNSTACGWQPVGAQHVRVRLEPGEAKKVIFLLGYHENPKDEKFDPPGSQTLNKRSVKPVIARYLDADEVERAFEALRVCWDGLLGRLQVSTPDEHTNRMVNIWNAYQVMVTFNFSRSASYFESGIGRGMGFRDSNQDLLGFMHLVPQRARERLLDLAATQLPDGGAYHQYQPLTKRGNNDVGSGFNDDPLWLVLAVAAYLKETGDWSILAEPVPYDNRPGTEEPLYAHLQRSIQYTLDRIGPHGLPLIGRADWNDCLNLNCFSDTPGQSFQTTTNKDGKVAESVFIAGLFVQACKEMAELVAGWQVEKLQVENSLHELANLEPANLQLPNLQPSTYYMDLAEQMTQTVMSHGWDGAWFRRAYDDFGRPVGSQECVEGQIFIEPQGICVMAGVGLDDGRARQALDSVAARLATPHGILLHQPAYTRYYLHLGEISSYPPGYKENGSIFCHTNPWIMIAEARLGRGERAHDYYLRINPSARQDLSEVHRCEPYVYAQTIAGRDAPSYGEAKNSWLTGTAAWNYVAITQWILGIRPAYHGLEIAPVIPPGWSGFDAVRIFRGIRYTIHIVRKGPGSDLRLEVDGQPLEGAVIPLPAPGTQEVHVTAFVGAAA